jgi:hypothetical protein
VVKLETAMKAVICDEVWAKENRLRFDCCSQLYKKVRSGNGNSGIVGFYFGGYVSNMLTAVAPAKSDLYCANLA